MCDCAAPAEIDEKEMLKNEIKRANERYSDLEKRISEYIDLLEPLEIRKGMENDWDEVVKNNQDDDYSKAWLNYTIHWAKMMQNLIKNKVIMTKSVIWETSFLADTYGITGFMHEMSVAALKKYWEYGEILDRGE